MRTLVKWIGVIALALALAAVALLAYAWQRSEAAMSRVYEVDDPPLSLPVDAASLAHGRHLYDTRGCSDCHGASGHGGTVMDAGPVIRLVAPNITPRHLLARGYDADGVARAIRHGLRADGTPLLVMPADDWSGMSDADTASLVAYLESLPASDHAPGAIELRPFGRVLYALGQFPLLPAEHVDHRPRERVAPMPAATAEFGAYVAAVCTGCHRADFGGGPPIAPQTPPPSDLTVAGLGTWTEADFFRAMREGRRPDGRELHPIMPWKAFARMTDIELRAIWMHLRQLPPRSPRA